MDVQPTNVPVEMEVPCDECGVEEVVIEGPVVEEGLFVEEVPNVEEVPCEPECETPIFPALMKPSFLHRFRGWLSR